MSEWLENIETVFGEYSNGKYRGQLMNAIEATYGSKYREALEDMLRRMTSGINRKQTSSGEERVKGGVEKRVWFAILFASVLQISDSSKRNMSVG